MNHIMTYSEVPEHSLISSQTFFFSFIKYPLIQSHRKEPGVFWHSELIGQSASWVQNRFNITVLRVVPMRIKPSLNRSLAVKTFVDINTSITNHVKPSLT